MKIRAFAAEGEAETAKAGRGLVAACTRQSRRFQKMGFRLVSPLLSTPLVILLCLHEAFQTSAARLDCRATALSPPGKALERGPVERGFVSAAGDFTFPAAALETVQSASGSCRAALGFLHGGVRPPLREWRLLFLRGSLRAKKPLSARRRLQDDEELSKTMVALE